MFIKKLFLLSIFFIIFIISLSAIPSGRQGETGASTSDATLSGSEDSILVIFSSGAGGATGDFIQNQDETTQDANFLINGSGGVNYLRISPNPASTPTAQAGDIKTMSSGANIFPYFYDGTCWRNFSDWACRISDMKSEPYNNSGGIAVSDHLVVSSGQVSLGFSYPGLAGYNYRKSITINSTTAGAQTNYQMKLLIHKGSGTDATGEVYLNNHCLSWTGTIPNDIRFTKSDGTTLLDYWIESSDANNATVWIEFDTIPSSGSATFYIYYSKSGETSASNGTTTFISYNLTGIVAFYHMDESSWNGTSGEVKDETGTNNGTASGAMTTTSSGKFGRAGEFDGSDDYIIIPDSDYWAIGTSNFSVATWIYFYSPITSHVGIWEQYVSNTSLWGIYETTVLYLSYNNGTWYEVSKTWGPSTGQWYHVVITRNSGTITWYINASSLGTDTWNQNIPNMSTNAWIGRMRWGDPPSGDKYHNGRFDEFMFFNRALGSSEVSAIYNNYMGKMGSYYNIRKYANPEPTWGTFGTEQQVGYYTTGSLTSTNFLLGYTSVSSIDSFYYNALAIPSGTGLRVQFSNNNTSWYNSSVTLNGWDTMTSGTHSINLGTLSWSGANFYYKIEFTSDGLDTPLLDEIRLYITIH